MSVKTPETACPSCSSTSTRKHGIQKNKLQSIQRYFCSSCKKAFTIQNAKNKTYPINIILNAVSGYNLGSTQTEIQSIISRKFKIKPSQKTISNWLNEYKTICAYSRLRKQTIKLYKPKSIISKQTLSHIQPYTFKYHKAKLDILTKENPKLTALKDYVEKITSDKFPHHIFTYYKNQKGFIFSLNNYKTPITGHIDILQIRNSLLHILDYKPDSNKTEPIEQLTIYALALSRKLNLPLYHFKCAWFDESSYYEFFPLHAVYKRER